MIRQTFGVIVGCWIALHGSAGSGETFSPTVPAVSNLYGAGHLVPPAPGGNGAGVLPTLINLPAGVGRTMQATFLTGILDVGPCCPSNGADGVASGGGGASNSWDGIGGQTVPRGRFVSAVFLDDTEPADPVPVPLAIPDIGFSELSPGLRQTFFVGDGLTGTGSGDQQTFNVPDGATRLFLGLQDAGPPDPSLPGWYGDNSGSVSGTVEIVAPAAVPALGFPALIALAASLALATRKIAAIA